MSLGERIGLRPGCRSCCPRESGRAGSRRLSGLLLCVLALAAATTVDAQLLTEVQKLIPADPHDVQAFGFAVATQGDLVVVGAPEDNENGSDAGAVYVFQRSGNGQPFVQAQKLLASDGSAGDQFGYSVAVNRQWLLVGAPFDDPDGKTDAGSAYVFELDAGSWVEAAKLVASDGASPDQFGTSVDIGIAVPADDPDEEELTDLVIGAPLVEVPGSSLVQGAIYVYELSNSLQIFVEQGKFMDTDPAASQLGWAVAVSGDTIVGGARADDQNGTDAGAVYPFVRQFLTNTWAPGPKGLPGNPASFDYFGAAVDVTATTRVIGAPRHPNLGVTPGQAYVIEAGLETQLSGSNGASGDRFGVSVAKSLGIALIGAPNHDDPVSDAGNAYYFASTMPGSWPEIAKLGASDAGSGDDFGFAVALDGATAVVGAPLDGHSGFASAGSAYVFELIQPCVLLDDDLVVSDQTFSDPQTREACNSLTAGPSVLVTAPDGDLTLRARQRVTLADGFRVESGAGLVVEVNDLVGAPAN